MEIQIVELPIKTFTNDYMEKVLRPMESQGFISKLRSNSSVNTVKLTFQMKRMAFEDLDRKNQVHKHFHLFTKLPVAELNAFDENDKLRHFDTVEEINEAFYHARSKIYIDAHQHQLNLFEAEASDLEDAARYIGLQATTNRLDLSGW